MSDLGGEPPCWAHLLEDGAGERSDGGGRAVVVDLGEVPGEGSGALWSLPHGGDLDANLVRLEPGGVIGEHVNDEVDVMMFVRSGDGHINVGAIRVDLAPEHLVVVPKGERRAVTAGPAGITYLSVHRRRGPLTIGGRRKEQR